MSSRTTFILLLLLVIFSTLVVTQGVGRRDPNDIVIWTQDFVPGRELLLQQLELYMEQHPKLKVSLIYYETEELRNNFIIAALGGSGPDLIYGPSDQVGPFEVMQIIRPMEDLFTPEELACFQSDALVWWKGHLYQIGDRIGNHLTLVYNKDLVPVPPKTTDELIVLGQKLTKDFNQDGLIDQYALAWNFVEPYFFVPFLGGYGGWVMDEQALAAGNPLPTLDTPATVKACQFILDLRNKYRIIPRECDYDMADAMFKQGKAAMIINGPWSWGGYAKAGVNFDLARIPQISETGLWPTPMFSPKGYSISINVRGKKLSNVVELLRFLLSAEMELQFTKNLNTIPSRKEALNNDIVKNNPILQHSIEQLEVAKPMPIDPAMRAIWDAMRPAYQLLFSGSLTPEQAARKMQEDAVRKIREMNE